MTDIRIVRIRHGKAVVSGETVNGCRWIKKHIYGWEEGMTAVTIDAEHVDEFEKLIQKEDLVVEVR